MKKLKIILSIILILLSVDVFAEENDKSTINLLKSTIIVLDESNYQVKKKYDVYTKFGKTPNERYFYKKFYNECSILYKNKIYKSSATYEDIIIDESIPHGFNTVKDDLLLYIGDRKELVNEIKNYEIGYSVNLDKGNKDNYTYSISDEIYDVKKVKFEIILPFEIKNEEIDFYLIKGNNLERVNPKYEIIDDVFIKGEYNNELKSNELLFSIDKSKLETTKNNTIIFLIIPIIIILIMFLKIKYVKIDKIKKE